MKLIAMPGPYSPCSGWKESLLDMGKEKDGPEEKIEEALRGRIKRNWVWSVHPEAICPAACLQKFHRSRSIFTL